MALEIMHVDMDAFFAAIEQLDNPALVGQPVIVGGINLDNRGVVSTASYEARQYGVHSAMPITEAKRLCPHGIYLPGRGNRYQELSAQIFSILLSYTPCLEKISIDEAFLDLSGCHRLFGDSIEIGHQIKMVIQQKLGLIASIGLSINKFLAKLASDLDKPDGFMVIKEEEINQVLEPLPIGKLWGVGRKTEEILNDLGINTIGKLKKLNQDELVAIFGKMGLQLYQLARGLDERSVEPEYAAKSISHEETFAISLSNKNELMACLMEMSAKVARRLRQKDLRGSTVFIKIRYDDFTTLTRRITLGSSTNSTDTIYQTGKRLLEKEPLLTRPVRLLGIGIGNFSKGAQTQLSLFSNKLKEYDLNKAIDRIKDRYGERGIIRARNLER